MYSAFFNYITGGISVNHLFHLIVLVCSTDKYILYLQTAVQQDKISTAANLDCTSVGKAQNTGRIGASNAEEFSHVDEACFHQLAACVVGQHGRTDEDVALLVAAYLSVANNLSSQIY